MRASFASCGRTALTLVMPALLGLTSCSGDNSHDSRGTDPSATAEGDGTSASPAAGGSASNFTITRIPKSNWSRIQVDVAGMSRSYLLAIPKTYDATKNYPLIVALAGDDQPAEFFQSYVGLDAAAGSEAIVAYPDGVFDLFTPFASNVDQQLVEVAIMSARSKASIDSSRIWAFGYSKGGFIANALACRKPGMFTAMAIHAGGAPLDTSGPGAPPHCPGIVGIPVLVSEGEFDSGIGAEYGAFFWASTNQCGSTRRDTSPWPCQTFDGCSAMKRVVFCKVPSLGHAPIWRDAASVSWKFLRALSP